MRTRTVRAAIGVALLAGLAGPNARMSAAPSDNQVTPGELVVDHPTLINLGFEWIIDGDANRNASVEVSYRKQGETAWTRGLPLLRLQGERIYQENSWNLVSPNMFAGSILDLEPDTAYEAELTDGARTTSIAFRTRSDRFPIGKTTLVPAGENSTPIVITESGTAGAYHLVTAAPGTRATIDLRNAAPVGVDVVDVQRAQLGDPHPGGVEQL